MIIDSKKSIKKINKYLVITLLLTCFFDGVKMQAKSISMNSRNKQVKIGGVVKIKLKNVNKKHRKKAKWSVKSGKKFVKIKVSKNRLSVKVIGKKAGKATLLCKIAGKRLVCKITVKSNIRVKPVVKTIANANYNPVETESPAPQATITPSVNARQTHIPTEDRLMVEPAKSTELPKFDERGIPIPYPYGGITYYFYGSDILRSSIEVMSFSSNKEVPKGIIGQLDLSEKQNGSVIAYYTDENDNGLYEMTIAQNGGVVANEDSSYICSCMTNIKGFENLYTENVRDLTRAFYQYIPDRSGGNICLDLGDYFDTSNVEVFDEMFGEAGSTGLVVSIRLGKMFNTDKSQSRIPAFNQGVWNMLSQVIAPNETVAKWARANKPYCEVVVEE